MSTEIQRLVNSHDGSGGRLDYSNRQMVYPMPTSRREFIELRRQAHDPAEGGPGSAAHSDLMHLYMQGYDADSFPDATGGIPRSVGDTVEQVSNSAAHAEKVWDKVHPMLTQIRYGDQSLAEMGPEQAREVVAIAMADALPEQRSMLVELNKAMAESTVKVWNGIDINQPEAFAEEMTYQAPSSNAGASDPTGYADWHNGWNQEPATGVERLMLKNGNADPSMFGIDVAHDGGLTYHHELAEAQVDNYTGGQ